MAKKHKLGTTVDKTECILWGWSTNTQGYPVKWDNGRTRSVTRLIWAEHNGPIPEGMCVCHKCDTPRCVNPDHFFLGTYRDNFMDSILKGRFTRAVGVDHGNSKLSEEDVREIRRLRQEGWTLKSLESCFGVCYSAIWKIVKRITWKHIT
jgi:hypothetical protein